MNEQGNQKQMAQLLGMMSELGNKSNLVKLTYLRIAAEVYRGTGADPDKVINLAKQLEEYANK